MDAQTMRKPIFACLIVLTLAGSVRAGSWTEQGDAGRLLSTNQLPLFAGDLTLSAISGTFNSTTDVDLYKIRLTGANFSASTVGGSSLDTQLFLFNSSGIGVLANDDSAGGRQSTISG